MPPSLNLHLGRRSSAEVVGLDIQPGFVAAVQARVNGAILAQRASVLPLAGDAMRDGEVVDEGALSETLRELFHGSGLSKRVRVGVANQRTVLRTLELPPVTDRKELAAAVLFQAQDQVPMPLSNAVLDFHPLGIVDTPSGPRQRVVLVAAQRDMIERLLGAVRQAGLRPEGVDLAAFALIRSLYRPDPEHAARVLYLNVDGLTNLAIAEGTACRFTRVVGGGLEGIAAELAERGGIPLTEARAVLAAVDLTVPPAGQEGAPVVAEPALPPEPDYSSEPEAPAATVTEPDLEADTADLEANAADLEANAAHNAREAAMGYAEMSSAPPLPVPVAAALSDTDVRRVVENGIHEIGGEVRNSLEFHLSQDGGGEVSHVALSGSALDLPGFAEALQISVGLDVHSHTVGLADESLAGTVSTHRLAVAAGLAATEAPQ